MSAVSLDSLTLQCVVAIACGLPGGGTAKMLATRSALSVLRVRALLTAAAKGGLVDKVQRGREVFWMSPAAARAVRAAKRQAATAPRWQRGGDLPDGPVRLQVPADAPLPFVCTAVSSVFALGAA